MVSKVTDQLNGNNSNVGVLPLEQTVLSTEEYESLSEAMNKADNAFEKGKDHFEKIKKIQTEINAVFFESKNVSKNASSFQPLKFSPEKSEINSEIIDQLNEDIIKKADNLEAEVYLRDKENENLKEKIANFENKINDLTSNLYSELDKLKDKNQNLEEKVEQLRNLKAIGIKIAQISLVTFIAVSAGFFSGIIHY